MESLISPANAVQSWHDRVYNDCREAEINAGLTVFSKSQPSKWLKRGSTFRDSFEVVQHALSIFKNSDLLLVQGKHIVNNPDCSLGGLSRARRPVSRDLPLSREMSILQTRHDKQGITEIKTDSCHSIYNPYPALL